MVIDDQGRLLAHQEFPARASGYAALLARMRSFSRIVATGVESTGPFGATLTRFSADAGEEVVEGNKPNRQARHRDGKSHRLDAEQIARSVLAATGVATPKSKSGPIEVIRTLRVARAGAIRARTQAFSNLLSTMIGAPSSVRDVLGLEGLPSPARKDDDGTPSASTGPLRGPASTPRRARQSRSRVTNLGSGR